MTHPNPGLLVVSRFRVPTERRPGFLLDAEAAMAVLAAQPGCRGVSLGQSTDEADLMLIRSEWDGVGAYRRGLSAFDVKVTAVPLLSTAIDEPSAYEVVVHHGTSGVERGSSGLAADAGEVGLGRAAAAVVPPVST